MTPPSSLPLSQIVFIHGTPEELDSYLYQTVGQDAIESVARALDVPLYRRVISGTALAQDSEYGGRDVNERGGVTGDETEDLYALLADVKVMQTFLMHPFSLVDRDTPQSQHPGAKGVSVGAILSNYQRVRVEHVSVSSLVLVLSFRELIHACVCLAVKGCP